ncbi:hypothetical protein MSP8887_01744 [Marinomonas spartinae]|uniref:hypothetical protein n=1 Tax=Marinomonas spartinae TaxID=1792290 RepID=UPI000808F665|nr:hypothetical protein [Marinomonas spartinae]SBS32508.1 hypothetical protein MSP8887_01744 [Marinomonas spartinae]
MNLDTSEKQKLLEPWLSVIGLLTVMWTPIERKIDECVFLLSSSTGNGKKRLSLNRKLDYIKQCLPQAMVCNLDIDEIIQLTKVTAQVRDVCVHGVIDSYGDNKMVIGKVQGISDDFHIEMFTYDQARLFSAGNNLNVLYEIWEKVYTDLSASAGS